MLTVLGTRGVDTCIVVGCRRKLFVPAYGWCQRHYKWWKQFGDPTAGIDLVTTERFWRKVTIVDDEDSCWIYGELATNYGQFWVDGGGVQAHVYSYRLANQVEIPKGLVVMHRCDVKRCVRPSHLRLGTYHDNTQDMMTKGRDAAPEGSSHWRAILTEETIPVIRSLRASGYSSREIAGMFGVHKNTINDIIFGRTWKHVPLTAG